MHALTSADAQEYEVQLREGVTPRRGWLFKSKNDLDQVWQAFGFDRTLTKRASEKRRTGGFFAWKFKFLVGKDVIRAKRDYIARLEDALVGALPTTPDGTCREAQKRSLCQAIATVTATSKKKISQLDVTKLEKLAGLPTTHELFTYECRYAECIRSKPQDGAEAVARKIVAFRNNLRLLVTLLQDTYKFVAEGRERVGSERVPRHWRTAAHAVRNIHFVQTLGSSPFLSLDFGEGDGSARTALVRERSTVAALAQALFAAVVAMERKFAQSRAGHAAASLVTKTEARRAATLAVNLHKLHCKWWEAIKPQLSARLQLATSKRAVPMTLEQLLEESRRTNSSCVLQHRPRASCRTRSGCAIRVFLRSFPAHAAHALEIEVAKHTCNIESKDGVHDQARPQQLDNDVVQLFRLGLSPAQAFNCIQRRIAANYQQYALRYVTANLNDVHVIARSKGSVARDDDQDSHERLLEALASGDALAYKPFRHVFTEECVSPRLRGSLGQEKLALLRALVGEDDLFFVLSRARLLEVLAERGSITFADATHRVCVKVSGLRLCSFLVHDGSVGVSCAWMCTLSETADRWQAFAMLVAAAAPSWTPEWLLTDMAMAMHNGVSRVHRRVKLRYCLFHVFRAWQTKLPAKASKKEVATRVARQLYLIAINPDLTLAQAREDLNTLIRELKRDGEAALAEYLVENYAYCVERWAVCARLGCRLHASETVVLATSVIERFHLSLKRQLEDAGRESWRMGTLLTGLQEYVDKYVLRNLRAELGRERLPVHLEYARLMQLADNASASTLFRSTPDTLLVTAGESAAHGGDAHGAAPGAAEDTALEDAAPEEGLESCDDGLALADLASDDADLAPDDADQASDDLVLDDLVPDVGSRETALQDACTLHMPTSVGREELRVAMMSSQTVPLPPSEEPRSEAHARELLATYKVQLEAAFHSYKDALDKGVRRLRAPHGPASERRVPLPPRAVSACSRPKRKHQLRFSRADRPNRRRAGRVEARELLRALRPANMNRARRAYIMSTIGAFDPAQVNRYTLCEDVIVERDRKRRKISKDEYAIIGLGDTSLSLPEMITALEGKREGECVEATFEMIDSEQ
jgi:hypothetical protein